MAVLSLKNLQCILVLALQGRAKHVEFQPFTITLNQSELPPSFFLSHAPWSALEAVGHR